MRLLGGTYPLRVRPSLLGWGPRRSWNPKLCANPRRHRRRLPGWNRLSLCPTRRAGRTSEPERKELQLEARRGLGGALAAGATDDYAGWLEPTSCCEAAGTTLERAEAVRGRRVQERPKTEAAEASVPPNGLAHQLPPGLLKLDPAYRSTPDAPRRGPGRSPGTRDVLERSPWWSAACAC